MNNIDLLLSETEKLKNKVTSLENELHTQIKDFFINEFNENHTKELECNFYVELSVCDNRMMKIKKLTLHYDTFTEENYILVTMAEISSNDYFEEGIESIGLEDMLVIYRKYIRR